MSEEFIDKILQEGPPIISVITEIELLSWKVASEKDFEVLSGFISDSLVIELEKVIKQKTAEIRKTYRIKLPDAIIAATASVYDLTLITRNIEDFKNISGLKIINPWNL